MTVDIYWNRHKKCFSVRKNGKVIQYRLFVLLSDAQWIVSESGRIRAVREGVRNVHAFVRGTMIHDDAIFGACFGTYTPLCKRVRYNPFEGHETFVLAESGDPVRYSKYAHLTCEANMNLPEPSAWAHAPQ